MARDDDYAEKTMKFWAICWAVLGHLLGSRAVVPDVMGFVQLPDFIKDLLKEHQIYSTMQPIGALSCFFEFV